jgi:hypothetical protein
MLVYYFFSRLYDVSIFLRPLRHYAIFLLQLFLSNVGIQNIKCAEALLYVVKASGGVVVYLHTF